MNQLTNNKHDNKDNKHEISNDTILKKSKVVPKRKIKILCNECNQRRELLNESHQICHICFKAKSIYEQSGNKIIDDFIKHTLINDDKFAGKMIFVPYDRFKNVNFIAEGGFSKIYKAIWIDGPIRGWSKKNQCYTRVKSNYDVVLKRLNNSKDITSKELNELKVFYEFSLKYQTTYSNCVGKYFGITQYPITQDVMIIMPYYPLGDLTNYITNDFYDISWKTKLDKLKSIINGLINIHDANIVHRDFHSGNIFFRDKFPYVSIGDLGISKSATESTDDNENYGIIPYMAPEIFRGQKYTKASDIYSFGMIMWEFMTGRRPFWDKVHDTELIIEIYKGSRPPIVTNAPEDYVDLMKECWHSDPNKRPTALYVFEVICNIYSNERKNKSSIIKSSDIGPVKKINPDKRKFVDNRAENDLNEGKSIKKIKLVENENNGYLTEELELDININPENPEQNNNEKYITQEIDFDI
ncbi:kinase-like domain-containing protein [Rhizophagus diaphanus]|nr:kinase-like domain-containing protein [Rhizophagus diaphanus] [Rhizophagus sp. MUCL 43196]